MTPMEMNMIMRFNQMAKFASQPYFARVRT